MINDCSWGRVNICTCALDIYLRERYWAGFLFFFSHGALRVGFFLGCSSFLEYIGGIHNFKKVLPTLEGEASCATLCE
jgi:hypothetical protein